MGEDAPYATLANSTCKVGAAGELPFLDLPDMRCLSFKSGHCLTNRDIRRCVYSTPPLAARREERYRRPSGAAAPRSEDHRMDIEAWLQGLGLERYVHAFRDNEIDWEVLPKLTSDDLREIGVTAIGHRRKLLEAIAAIGATAPTALSTAFNAPAPADAERRQLTVMFCDLVGSTPLAARYDPEDLREIVGAYHRCVTETVGRFGGFVAKYMGDGVLIYFGYPEAHEDDAERAVRAGLSVIDAVVQLGAPEPLNVRLGIASGLVVVGDLIGAGAAQERGVVGETPNLAARLQALAPPGTLIIADTTRRQIGGLFELEDLGPRALAGYAAPQRAWRVVGESGILSRFEALRSEDTPLVGRDEELDLLLRRWHQAKAGEGRVVLISGEPGIGKSRLTAALSQAIEGEPHTRLRYFCSPHHQDSALHPFIAQLERAAGFVRDDAPATKLEKLDTLLAEAAEPGDISLIVEMLSLPGGVRCPPLDLTPQRKKERTLAALLRQFQVLTRRQPVLMIFEDLHWIDPTSRELLDLTVERIADLPVLMVATYRPEFQPPWAGQSQVTVIGLNRLSRSEGAALVRQLAGNFGALPPDLVDEIVERTDGVPLFVEELTKAMIEAGTDRGRASVSAVPAVSLTVPATLHASLMERIDRLGLAAKQVAQVGAAIGRDFSYELLAAAAQFVEPELRDALRRLVDAGLVFQRGVPPSAEYLFKHALVQDTAYSTLLRGPRQALHRRIAEVLEQRFPDLVEARPELAAHHFGEAAVADKAIAYWHLAGKLAVAKSAVSEAIAQLRRGLDLLGGLPESQARKQLELDIHVTLIAALSGGRGYADPEVVTVLERARRLVTETAGAGTPQHFSVLYGLWAVYFVNGKAKATHDNAAEFLSLAQSGTASGPLLIGHRLFASALMMCGEYREALAHIEKAASLYRPEEHRQFAAGYSQDIGVSAFVHLSWALWHCGFPDQSARACDRALQYCREFGHAYTLAYALWHIGIKAVFARQVAEAGACADDCVALANEHGFPLWPAYGVIIQGWVAALAGDAAAGIARIREGMARVEAMGSQLFHPCYFGLLAEALALAGEIDEGLAALDRALANSAGSGQKGTDAELHRLRGELVRQLPRPDPAQAEASFRTALVIAREQGTRGYELRVATSLARLWGEQRRRYEARELLAPVYDWFTEGFDTADLKEAKVVLDQLA
jgi:class 3 adenylate cyclase/predicted ATPase